jgi:hypothetical protein
MRLVRLVSLTGWVFVIALLVVMGCRSAAQPHAYGVTSSMRCAAPLHHVAILNTAAERKYGPIIHGEPVPLSNKEVERAECVLRDFISWHNGIGRAARDSVHLASGGLIRPECLTRNGMNDYKQYAGERSPTGELIIHMQSFCKDPLEPSFPGRFLTTSWFSVDDGGDCYFEAEVNLSAGTVIRYSINGPYPTDGWCP